VLRSLAEIGYRGLVSVELPRHSHAAPTVAERSLAFLRSAERAAPEPAPESAVVPAVQLAGQEGR
jgi:L-ribulose-5-phosphate 3-epimerase